MYQITNLQARKFLLLKHGLLQKHKYQKKNGIIEFIKDVGCIQYDPVDVCGRNADLVLQARIKDYRKADLYQELYEKRTLIDYWDKNMSIYLMEDWPYFERIRKRFKKETRSMDEVEKVYGEIVKILEEKESITSKDLEFKQKVSWYWMKSSLSKVALETLYYRGDLVIHHKRGTIRHFSLANRIVPKHILDQEDPHKSDFDYNKWRLLRRLKAVGLLWNKPSYALIFTDILANERNQIFSELLKAKEIIEVQVDDIKTPFYIYRGDEEILKQACSNEEQAKRCEFLAPLDNLLWDRKIIKTLFDFDYTWEIYFPKEKRLFGHYVLPVLYGTNFIGRIEIINEKSVLIVRRIWFEDNVTMTKTLKKIIKTRIEQFKEFNEAQEIRYEEEFFNE